MSSRPAHEAGKQTDIIKPTQLIATQDSNTGQGVGLLRVPTKYSAHALVLQDKLTVRLRGPVPYHQAGSHHSHHGRDVASARRGCVRESAMEGADREHQ